MEALNIYMRINEITSTEVIAIERRHRQWLCDLVAKLKATQGDRENIAELHPAKPKTPEQQRLASLQATAKRAQLAAKTEHERQKIAKAQQSLAQVRQQAIAA